MPAQVRPLFFGASFVALEKKTGGVRPIAVGCSLRRLVAKIAGWRYGGASQSKATLYGVVHGAEAAVHATRTGPKVKFPMCFMCMIGVG